MIPNQFFLSGTVLEKKYFGGIAPSTPHKIEAWSGEHRRQENPHAECGFSTN